MVLLIAHDTPVAVLLTAAGVVYERQITGGRVELAVCIKTKRESTDGRIAEAVNVAK